jgi:hypothetical protein
VRLISITWLSAVSVSERRVEAYLDRILESSGQGPTIGGGGQIKVKPESDFRQVGQIDTGAVIKVGY